MIIVSAYIALVCAGCTPSLQTGLPNSTHSIVIPIAKRSRRSRAWSICRRKYGKKLSGVTMKKGNKFICHYRKSRAQIRANCRKRYGKRFIKLLKTRKGYACSYNPSRKQFVRLCKRKYGRQYLRVTRKKGQKHLHLPPE